MSKRSVAILSAVAAALVLAVAAPRTPAIILATPVANVAPDSAGRPDFTGTWALDPAHSDMPQRGEGRMRPDGDANAGPRGMGDGERRGEGAPGGPRGDRMGRGGERGGARAAMGTRPPALPPLIHITQTHSVVSLEDSTGAVLEEISMRPAAADTLAHAPGAQVSHGAWQDSALVVERGGTNGFSLTRAISLEQGGLVLVMRTHFESADGSRARDFRRVYRRVESQ